MAGQSVGNHFIALDRQMVFKAFQASEGAASGDSRFLRGRLPGARASGRSRTCHSPLDSFCAAIAPRPVRDSGLSPSNSELQDSGRPTSTTSV
jgi:hypothetical protein